MEPCVPENSSLVQVTDGRRHICDSQTWPILPVKRPERNFTSTSGPTTDPTAGPGHVEITEAAVRVRGIYTSYRSLTFSDTMDLVQA